jgi:hypothetical protein
MHEAILDGFITFLLYEYLSPKSPEFTDREEHKSSRHESKDVVPALDALKLSTWRIGDALCCWEP